MTTKTRQKQTRRAVSLSGDLHKAMKVHCERAGLSLSGYAEMILRREVGLPERESHLERSPILAEAHLAKKERAKSTKASIPANTLPSESPPTHPQISATYDERIAPAQKRENRADPSNETTTPTPEVVPRRMGGPIEPLPAPTEILYYLPPEVAVEAPEPLMNEVSAESVIRELPNHSDGLDENWAEDDQDTAAEVVNDSAELDRKDRQTPVLAHEEVRVPVEEKLFEPGGDPGTSEFDEWDSLISALRLKKAIDEMVVVEPEPEKLAKVVPIRPVPTPEPEPEVVVEPEPEEVDPRPIRAIRTDRPSREFMTKGERERAERARLIAERQKAREDEEKAKREVEKKELGGSRRSGNVFSF